MPTVEIFDGIKIEMYVNDRNPPHVHIKYAKHKCILEIQTGNICRQFTVKTNEKKP